VIASQFKWAKRFCILLTLQKYEEKTKWTARTGLIAISPALSLDIIQTTSMNTKSITPLVIIVSIVVIPLSP
jgi:hypothetical protein